MRVRNRVFACVGPSLFSSDWPRAQVAILRGKEVRGILCDDLGERPLTGPPPSPPPTRIALAVRFQILKILMFLKRKSTQKKRQAPVQRIAKKEPPSTVTYKIYVEQSCILKKKPKSQSNCILFIRVVKQMVPITEYFPCSNLPFQRLLRGGKAC